MGKDKQTLSCDDCEKHFVKQCAAAPLGTKVIMQNTQKVEPFNELFYTPVIVEGKFQVQGMLDSGSMAL